MDADAAVRGRALVHLRVSLFANSGHHHGHALSPCRLQQQKRKPSVAGNQAELHGYLITPRSLCSMNAASSAASSPSSSLIFSRACVVFILDATRNRNALCNTFSRSGENPRRASPTLLIPKALFSRLDEVNENGSTSWVTIVPPPINAYLPTTQC